MQVNVKWNKQLFENVEVDLEQAPIVFKTQLFTLSGVPPERQKVMIKARMLGDDSWDTVAKIRNGQTVLLMGTAEGVAVVQAPKEVPQFLEDRPPEEQDFTGLSEYGAGLRNLGNTCYMNATLQMFYSVPELREAVTNFDSRRSTSAAVSPASSMVSAAGDLFGDMTRSTSSVIPLIFLTRLRRHYPQFGEMGRNRMYRQQDAEECFSQIVHTLTETIKVNPEDGASQALMRRLFGIDFVTKLSCEETQETLTVLENTATTLKCNIPQNRPINHVHEGIAEGLKADRSQRSSQTETDVLFTGTSEISKLSPYLVLHMIRFTYKIDTQKKAKILRKVAFSATLDLYEFCSVEYRAELDVPRKRMEALRNAEIEKAREQNDSVGEADQMDSVPTDIASSEPTSQPSVPPELTGMVISPAAELRRRSDGATGRYLLQGVLTHKGRDADSGHYIAWIKQKDGQWIKFDDEDLSFVKEDEVMALSGGGDWHASYLLLYKAETVDRCEAQSMVE